MASEVNLSLKARVTSTGIIGNQVADPTPTPGGTGAQEATGHCTGSLNLGQDPGTEASVHVNLKATLLPGNCLPNVINNLPHWSTSIANILTFLIQEET